MNAHCGTIPASGVDDACIILQASAEAKSGISNVVITGTGRFSAQPEEEAPLKVQAEVLQETYAPGGGRHHWPVQMHTVSVKPPGDIRNIKLNTYDVTLKPGEKTKIEVEFERAPEMDKNVTLSANFQHLGNVFGNSMPPGVKVVDAESKILVTGTETKGHLVLQAAPDAKPSPRMQVPIMAHISINFVMKLTFSSDPLFVTIAKAEE
ncbi:MAG: hypothetical protein R3C11_04555 [Planctomycetaceae bacterium]